MTVRNHNILSLDYPSAWASIGAFSDSMRPYGELVDSIRSWTEPYRPFLEQSSTPVDPEVKRLRRRVADLERQLELREYKEQDWFST